MMVWVIRLDTIIIRRAHAGFDSHDFGLIEAIGDQAEETRSSRIWSLIWK